GGEKLIPGGGRGQSGRGKDVLVVPEHNGDVGRMRNHRHCAVHREGGEDVLVEQASDRTGGHGIRQVCRKTVGDPLLKAAAGPLEVDVWCVAPVQQVRQSDGLVEVVVLVV